MFNIPELNRLVYLQLSRNSLAQCARVNRTWNEGAMPFLFETIPTLPYHYQQLSFLEMVVEDYCQKSYRQLKDTRLLPHQLEAILHNQRTEVPGFHKAMEAFEGVSQILVQGQTLKQAANTFSEQLQQDKRPKETNLGLKGLLRQMESIREMVHQLDLGPQGSNSGELLASQAPALPQTLPSAPPSTPPRSTTLARYGHCIRRIPNVCTLLQYLQDPDRCHDGEVCQTSYQLASHFLEQCPNLRFHHVDICQYHIDSDDLFFLMKKHIIPVTQHLSIGLGESVNCSTDLTTSILQQILSSTSDRLESLRLKIGLLDGSIQKARPMNQYPIYEPEQRYLEAKKAWEFADDNKVMGFPGLKTLKEFRIEKCMFSFQAQEIWRQLWDHCGHIESLVIGDVCEEVLEHLAEGISDSMPRLHNIYFQTDDPATEYKLNDATVAKILSAGKRGWTAVHFDMNAVVGPAALSALVQHYLTLEDLHFVQNVDSNALIPILVACPNLRELVTIKSEAILPVVLPEITAVRFIDQDPWTYSLRPWACEGTLKKLKVRITEVPPVVGALPTIQRKVYERLARLENLEVLWLGHQPQVVLGEHSLDDALFHQETCLDMTLASGLGKLDRLQNLSELNLSGMEHGLDYGVEAEWMAKHWPKLAVVSGLGKNSEAASWFAYNRPYVFLD
ncbi:hypothetical protein BGZ93_006705 [Podila epicladia]|nr:hypothetical protein BGZ92_006718 [Podila epicladia]KAG0094833.1 hypothetical protein BGZ93_006705 [Podila epicladia]